MNEPILEVTVDTVPDKVEPTVDSIPKEELREQAIPLFGSELVDKRKDCLEEANTHEEYQTLLLNAVKDDKRLKAEVDIRNKALAEAEELRLDAIKNQPNIVESIKNAVYKQFNTSAPTPVEICNYLASNKQLPDLTMYDNSSMFYVLDKLLNQPCVIKPAIEYVHRTWEGSVAATTYIESYLHDTYPNADSWDEKAEALVALLPTEIQQETSPKKYKQYRAIELLKQQTTQPDETELYKRIFENTDTNTNYCASFEEATEANEPIKMAEYTATQNCIEAESDSSPLEKSVRVLGAGYASVVGLKYKVADNFNSALEEGLGEYVDIYKQNKEEVQRRKEELNAKRLREQEIEAHVLNARQAQMNASAVQQPGQVVNSRPVLDAYGRPVDAYGRPLPVDAYGNPLQQGTPVNQRIQRNQYMQPNAKYGGMDYRPKLPVGLMVSVAAVFVALITLAFMKQSSIFVFIGLGVAAFSGLGIPSNGKTIVDKKIFGMPPMLSAVLGFALYFVAMGF